MGAIMEEVKGALSGMTASQTTVATLQALLGLETASAAIAGMTTAPSAGRIIASKRKTATSGAVKGSATRTQKAQPVAITEDVSKPLSPREKYALATETVNSGLRVLTEAAKSLSRATVPSHDGPPSTPTSISRGALQPRSNNITPKRPPPEKARTKGTEPTEMPSKGTSGPDSVIVATAECTRMAFAFLRSTDTQKLGVREMPRLQLETGMLALVGKLITLGLEAMAVKELRQVKRRLDFIYGASKDAKPATAKPKANATQSERETLASLLRLSANLGEDLEALNLAVTHCMHTLKIIALSHKPAVIEEVAQYLETERTNSPCDLLCRQAKTGAQSAKVAKQLEALSQTILSLCPSPSTAGDAAATDTSKIASPEAVFSLQTTALQVRQHWWKLAGHQPDINKELLEPFLRCAAAFARRSAATLDAQTAYTTLTNAFTTIDPTASSESISGDLFNIHNLLVQQGERAGKSEEALKWASASRDDCKGQESNHARRVSAQVRFAALRIGCLQEDYESSELDAIVGGLQSKLTGTAADFDNLLSSLHGFAIATSASEFPQPTITALRGVHVLAAGFALRYARSYPGRGTDHVTAMLNSALRWSRNTEDLLSWVTAEAATVFIQAGALKKVAEVVRRRPLAEAWTISADTVALGRICHAVILGRVRAPSRAATISIVDSEELTAEERVVLLELQLESTARLSSKTKYHGVLKQVLPELLRNLSKVYTSDEHPVRRARVALAVSRLHETSSDLLTAEDLAEWQKPVVLDEHGIGNDSGLLPYLDDVKAALDVTKAFSDGRPLFGWLKPSLLAWSRLVHSCADAADLRDRIDDRAALSQQLRMIASYLAMRGDEQGRLPVLNLLERLDRLRGNEESASHLTASVELARCYLELGHSQRAEKSLGRTESISTCGIEVMQRQLVQAEYFLAVDSLERCRQVLVECKSQREQLTPDRITKDQRRTYELLHAEAWLVHSKYALEAGEPHDALSAAKRSVKILNSMWAALERAEGSRRPNTPDEALEASDPGVENLTKGVSKLQLTPKDEASKSDSNTTAKGATFWPLVPILTKVLMHLSEMYSHHGLFGEANYYSERAISIAESVGSDMLLSRIRSHRAQLLTLAGRLEEAELCLTQGETTVLPEPSLPAVERLSAKSALRTKEASIEEGLQRLEKALQMVEKMASEDFITKLERFDDGKGLSDKTAALTLTEDQPKRVTPKAAGSTVKRTVAKSKASKLVTKRVQPSALTTPINEQTQQCYLLSKIKADIMLKAICLRLKLGQDIANELSQLTHFAACSNLTMRRKVAEHIHLMAQANLAVETDVTMNVLTESTLSLPSFLRPEHTKSAGPAGKIRSSSPADKKTTAKSKRPAPKAKPSAQTRIADMLQAARDCLLEFDAVSSKHSCTTQIHLESALLAKSSMLLSAVRDPRQGGLLHSLQEGLSIDEPRMKAMQYERQAMNTDRAMSNVSEPLSWPTFSEPSETQAMRPADFQTQYIDIIPKSWTAVSICLSEDASELYITRYRSKQQPLILRLPFSRHKLDDIDEEAFNYAKGRAELREIIELSDYTCHSSRNTDAKGAKSTWWSDREALDRRMHELLINMENIWFGGFKSIFSRDQQDAKLLARFRRSFEDVLDRYLPSRHAAKSKGKKLALDDKVLELYIGLGHDQDGVIDLDEPLADLLYFVVDLLQFSGERNAYDEIDFDSMAVDVLDALRSYHEGLEGQISGDQHLILVLDRRLQAFPWENMPCLQDQSVSRVGSMQSLRECIMAVRTSSGPESAKLPYAGGDCHVIERTSGTYILNPSSDLKATQTMLSPALQSLTNSTGQPWTSIVNEAPDEQRFTNALQDSSVLLYFGHGAGSQYIRPRAIKRLEQCSEVVWLMGCSSGAVIENDDLEPTAVPHAYLLAGSYPDAIPTAPVQEKGTGRKCLSVLATLWDVTDKDIDRFSLAVGEEWGLFPPSTPSQLPAKTAKRRAGRQIVAAPATPQQVPKTPKTPKVRKTPAAALAKTPARARGGGGGAGGEGDGKKKSLVQAVARSREVCYLRYLNGAAAVVYGVPVYLGD